MSCEVPPQEAHHPDMTSDGCEICCCFGPFQTWQGTCDAMSSTRSQGVTEMLLPHDSLQEARLLNGENEARAGCMVAAGRDIVWKAAHSQPVWQDRGHCELHCWPLRCCISLEWDRRGCAH